MFALMLSMVIIETKWFFTPLILGVLLAITTISLIHLTERTNKTIAEFLLSIKHGGFTQMFDENQGGLISKKLGSAFNEIIEEFQKLSLSKESHYQYLQTLNENIGVAIISFNQEGVIEFINSAAKTLLKQPNIKSLEGFRRIDEKLYKAIDNLQSGERAVLKVVIDQELKQLSIQAKDFILRQRNFRLILMQNIHNELEEQEVEAWQKLISVLTHEIMNSVTPIVSLTSAVNQLIHKNQYNLVEEDRNDIITSLKTIENRSKGLMQFVNAYKDYSKTPELKVSEFKIVDLVERLLFLLKPDMDRNGIKFKLNCRNRELKARADYELIEQVIINLLKNAIEALKDWSDALISVEILRGRMNKIAIIIKDNGRGVSDEVLDKMFVPFFTTKKMGTGVGLSFARQVMKLHRGKISATSELNNGTIFNLEF